MSVRTIQILKIMHILAWVTFVGLLIQAGSILVSYVISYFQPEAAQDLYQGLDLYNLRKFSFWHYTSTVSFMFAISGMKAFAAFLVIKVLRTIKLANPFQKEVVRLLERISYLLIGTWAISIFYKEHSSWLMKVVGPFQENWGNTGEFIFVAGIVFIFSQIFKRGVEMQSENELTI